MFREKEICDAIRTAYLHLFPDKKERKRALSRLDLELVAQGVRYRGENVLAYRQALMGERARRMQMEKENARLKREKAGMAALLRKHGIAWKENLFTERNER